MADTKSIEVNLGKDVKPGRYSLAADWDWDRFRSTDFSGARAPISVGPR